MKKVLALATALLGLNCHPALAEKFCPSGWICGDRDPTKYQMHVAPDGREICSLRHLATSDDGALHMQTQFFSDYTKNTVLVGFGISIIDAATSTVRPLILRSIRLLSADRKLDTREWKLDKANTALPLVQHPISEENKEIVQTVINVSSGDAFGVLAETEGGRKIRFEVRSMARDTENLRRLQACFTHRARLMQE